MIVRYFQKLNLNWFNATLLFFILRNRLINIKSSSLGKVIYFWVIDLLLLYLVIVSFIEVFLACSAEES